MEVDKNIQFEKRLRAGRGLEAMSMAELSELVTGVQQEVERRRRGTLHEPRGFIKTPIRVSE
jgi:hypothetical protein